MLKKNINLLPEDLRKNIGKISKIQPKKDFDLSTPTKDVFGIFRKNKDNASKGDEVLEEQDNSISNKTTEEMKSAPIPKPLFSEKKKTEEKKPVFTASLATSSAQGYGGSKKAAAEEEKKATKTAKGIFTISKSRPEIFFLLKLFFAKFNKPGQENFIFKKIFGALGKDIKSTSPQHLNINLVLKEEEFFEAKGKEILKTLYIEIAICLSVILVFYFALAFSQWRIGDKGKKMKIEITSVEGQIDKIKKDNKEMIDVQKKLLYIKDLLSKHVHWTNFFVLLEKYTLPEVYYEGFDSAIGETLDLKGTAKNSQDMVRQIIALRNAFDFIQSVEVKDITALKEKEEVSFIIGLTLVPEIFLSKQNDN